MANLCLQLAGIPSLPPVLENDTARWFNRRAVARTQRWSVIGSGVPLAWPMALGPLTVRLVIDDLACGPPGAALCPQTKIKDTPRVLRRRQKSPTLRAAIAFMFYVQGISKPERMVTIENELEIYKKANSR